jgi:hypothetical protein
MGDHTHWYFKERLPLLEVYFKNHEFCHPLQPVVEKVWAPIVLPDLKNIFEQSAEFSFMIGGKRVKVTDLVRSASL